jgi:hypothetical protein
MFASGKFTYERTYTNPNGYPIVTVRNDDERCAWEPATFPQSNASFCLDSMGPF